MKTEELKEVVSWQGVTQYTTTRGKVKDILTGIPNNKFWDLFRAEKAELKAAGVTVRNLGKAATGTYVKDGVSRTRYAKQWEVVCWISNHNAAMAAELQQEANQPF